MKTCSNCGKRKRESEFQIRRASPDGLTASCKQCLRDRDRARYPKERVYRLEQHKEYVKTVGGRKASNEAKRRWIERNKLQRACHHILNNAVRDGKVKKPERCSRCRNKGRIEGHHDDYYKPLEVIWLCPPCHKKLHTTKGE